MSRQTPSVLFLLPLPRTAVIGAVWGALGTVAILTALLSGSPLEAQVLYGSLTGTVTDPAEAAIPNATVELVNVGTGAVRAATTGLNGGYLFSDLQPGRYRVAVSAPSLSRFVQESVQIDPNRILRLDVTLQIAQTTETVTVAGSEIALQADRADVSANISTRQLAELPVTGTSGRNFQSLMQIVPGAVMAGEQNSAAGNPQRAISFNVNGVSRLQNNTRIDGSSVVYPWLPTNIAYVPPAEAIETVNIVTNSFNAEQGLAGGAAVNVSLKTGTNNFHGSAWVYDTNSHFKARNYFQTTPQNPKDILNQFGLTFGGPVWIPKVYNGKNKLFFFVDWERTTRRQISPIRLYSLATQDLRNGVFPTNGTVIYDPASAADPRLRTPFPGNVVPTSRIDLASAELIRRMPLPNIAGASFANNYTANGVATYDRDNVDIKVNYNVNDRIGMFGRYSISPSNIFDPPALGAAGGDSLNGGQNGNAPGRIQVAGSGLTYSITPHLLVDANVGFTRQHLGAENVDINENYGLDLLKIPGTNGPDRLQGGFPSFQISNWANLGNPNTGNPFLFRDNQYVASANLSWTHSAHTLRFGWDYQNQQINHFQPQGGTFQTARGTFTFSGQSTALQNGPSADRFNSWADFLLGDAATAGKVTQILNPDSLRMHVYALYAQDQWQVTRKVTINYGLRWEWYPFPRRDHGGVSRFDPATGNVYIGGLGNVPDDTYASSGAGEFLPRLGIAYRVNEKLVIRAGAGFSADPKPFIDFRNSYPIIVAGAERPAQFNGADNPYLPVTTLRQGLTVNGVGAVPDFSSGVIKLPATIGTTTFPKNAMRKYIESWNFIVQRQLGRDFTAQAGYVGTRAVGQQQFININAGAPGLGNAGRLLYSSIGSISDINEIMPFKTTTYDALQSQITKRFSGSIVGAVYTYSKAINWADNDANPRIQWPAAWNQNRGLASYDRPHNFQTYFVLDSPWGKGQRWLQNGVAGKLLGGWQLNGILSAISGAPIYITQNTGNSLNAAGSSQIPDQVKATVAILGGIGIGHPYFDTTAYAPVNIPAGQPQRFGNAGRNNIRGPGYVNLDSGLFRNFEFFERLRIQFRVEALNVLNHTNFSNPASNISDPSTFGYVTSTVGANGVGGTGERQFRFALRLLF